MGVWLVSLPLKEKRRDRTWEILQSISSGLSTNSKFEIPELRVGTLDTLMLLSDDLAKTSQLMETVVTKIRRTVGDLGGTIATGALKVEGLPAEAYLQRFKWDEAKYPSRRPLKELVDKVTELIGCIEDDLKVKVGEYNNLKSQLGAVARKAGGSLAVRDISTIVKPDQMIDSENLTTLFVVVSKFALKEWETSYEKLSNFVVPRSSRLITEDTDYALVSVVLFKRVVDDFKASARSKGYQVREYKPPEADGGELSAAQVEQLRREVDSKKAALEQWCKTAYGEAFSAWTHGSAIRLFVESILRYGLPPAFLAATMKPVEKSEQKLRSLLAENFGDGKQQYWQDDGMTVVGLQGELESYPYVSITLNIEA